MKVNLTPGEKLEKKMRPVLDQIHALTRDYDKESGAPEGMMDVDMRCRLVAGICHDLQLEPLTVATLMIAYLAAIEENCPDCQKRRAKK